MQFYILSNNYKADLSGFAKTTAEQNAVVARNLSFLILTIIVGFYALTPFVNYNRIVSNPQDYTFPFLFLFASSALYTAFFYILKKWLRRVALTIKRSFSLIYALCVIIGSMWITFIAQHNPGNTMTMFLMGIFAIAVLYVFGLKEAIIVSIFTLAVFITGLRFFQHNDHLLWQNTILGGIVVITFFFISRVLFSYHLNYYLQLKTIEQKNKEITSANKVKTEILGIVAHDLRSPISQVLALVGLVKDVKTADKERIEYYDLIENCCRNAEYIIHDLIEAARETDQEAFEKEQINLNRFLQSVGDQWKRRLPESKQLICQLPDNEVVAHIHEKKMGRVLDNLINNAVKFTADNGIIWIDLRNKPDKIEISVSDNGVGIPYELQPHLFDRFSKAGRKGLNGEKSYGLGLSICQQIVSQHGGIISVNSKPGHGTTFNIQLMVPQAN